MFNDDMILLGSKRSVIRELFEFGKAKAQKGGKDSVFDFSLGNPNVPSPKCVDEAILSCSKDKDAHAYTSAQGSQSVRRAIARHIRQTFGADMDENHIYMTCGAAASLCISIRALSEPDDEFIVLRRTFPNIRCSSPLWAQSASYALRQVIFPSTSPRLKALWASTRKA